MKSIEENEMGPFYKIVCKDLKWNEDQTLVNRLTATNEKTVKELVSYTLITSYKHFR